jgi:hypothetical protein
MLSACATAMLSAALLIALIAGTAVTASMIVLALCDLLFDRKKPQAAREAAEGDHGQFDRSV